MQNRGVTSHYCTDTWFGGRPSFRSHTPLIPPPHTSNPISNNKAQGTGTHLYYARPDNSEGVFSAGALDCKLLRQANTTAYYYFFILCIAHFMLGADQFYGQFRFTQNYITNFIQWAIKTIDCFITAIPKYADRLAKQSKEYYWHPKCKNLQQPIRF